MLVKEVVMVGVGSAEVGIASLLNQCDMNCIVLEKNEIGVSFLEWPKIWK